MKVIIFLALAMLFPISLLPSVIHMVIADKKLAAGSYKRHILLGELPNARHHDVGKQIETLLTCFDRLNTLSKTSVLVDLQSQRPYPIKTIAGSVNRDLSALLKREAQPLDYIFFTDSQDKIVIINNILTQITAGKKLADLLAIGDNSFTIGEVLAEYEKTISMGITISRMLKEKIRSQKTQKAISRALDGFEFEKLKLTKLVDKLGAEKRALSCFEFMYNLQTTQNSQEVDEEDKAIGSCLDMLNRYTPILIDDLIELSLLAYLLSSDDPQPLVTLSSEINNQRVINVLIAEGYELVYDSKICLQDNTRVQHLYDGKNLSSEWLAHYPTTNNESLDRHILALDSNILELMYAPRRLFPNTNDRTSKDEL